MKLNKEHIEEIKRLSESGDSIRSIAKLFQVSHSTISYHLNKEAARKTRRRWWNNLTKERRKEYYDKRKPYLAKYMKKRYNEDEEFREKKVKYQRNYRKNKSINNSSLKNEN